MAPCLDAQKPATQNAAEQIPTHCQTFYAHHPQRTSPPAGTLLCVTYLRQEPYAAILQCGIFAHGFDRARCDDCGHDYFVAFSCKGRGVCHSCNTRRMVQTAAV